MPMPIEVHLTKEDVGIGLKTLVDWVEYAKKNGVPEHYGAEKDDPATRYHHMFFGYIGEIAYSKYRKVPFEPKVGYLGKRDVDGHAVRTTHARGRGLQFRTKDAPDMKYVKVSVCSPDFSRAFIEGWAYGHDIRDNGKEWKPYPDKPAMMTLGNDELRDILTIDGQEMLL